MPSLTEALPKGFAICLYLAVLPVANAQFLNQSGRLFVPDEVGFARLGESAAVSADGNTAILGGGNDNRNNTLNSGWQSVGTVAVP
jgi:hypothetical protein